MLFKNKKHSIFLYLNLTGEKQMKLIELLNLRVIRISSYQAILFPKSLKFQKILSLKKKKKGLPWWHSG